MAQNNNQKSSLLDSLQSEVSHEASPLLQFITKHARTIVIIFVLFIVAIIANWIYSRYARSATMERRMDVGKILVMTDHNARMAALDKYLETSPKEMRTQILFAVMESAIATENFEKASTIWLELGKEKKGLDFLSKMGAAQAFAAQEKYSEAIGIYEGLVEKAKDQQKEIINREILSLSELSGNLVRAVQACEALLADPMTTDSDRSAWSQKLAALRLKIQAGEK